MSERQKPVEPRGSWVDPPSCICGVWRQPDQECPKHPVERRTAPWGRLGAILALVMAAAVGTIVGWPLLLRDLATVRAWWGW